MELTAFNKNKHGLTAPGIPALQVLHDNLGVSIDGLLFGTGSMLIESEKPEPSPPDFADFWDQKMPGVRELLEHMEKEPKLRHKMLAFYYESMEESGGEREQIAYKQTK